MSGFNGLISKGFLVLGLCAALVLWGCAAGREPVMTIRDKTDPQTKIVVTRSEYDTLYDSFVRRLDYDQKGGKAEALKNPMVQEQLKQTTLNRLIFLALLRHDAARQKITVTDPEVRQFKAENLKSIGGEEGLKGVLKAEGFTEAEFDENLKNDLLLKKFIEITGGEALKIPEPEILLFYNSNKPRFYLKERVRTAHVLLKAIDASIKRDLLQQDNKMTREEVDQRIREIRAAKKAEAEKILAQVVTHPGDFEKLAREKSDDKVSAVFGGDLNYLYEATTDPNFWNAALETAKTLPRGGGDTAGKFHPRVVETVFGYHVIRVQGYKPEGQQRLAEVRKDIEGMLTLQRKQRQLIQWVNQKRASADIEYAEGYKPAGFDLNREKVDVGAGEPAAAPQSSPQRKPAG